jgi:hypothetical protein
MDNLDLYRSEDINAINDKLDEIVEQAERRARDTLEPTYKEYLIINMTDKKVYNDTWQVSDINRLNKGINDAKSLIKDIMEKDISKLEIEGKVNIATYKNMYVNLTI